MSQPNHPAYTRCPKCGHSPLPHNQAFPAECPACGIILAKFAVAPTQEELKAKQREAADEEHGPRWTSRIFALATFLPPRVDSFTFWGRVALLAAFTIWGLSLIGADVRTGELYQSFIHGPLLVFHEAGHVLFMLFGQFLTVAGGTLGQLIMPAVLCGALLWKRDPFGAAIGLWLFGVSVLDVAPYVYDAKVPQLMLLGGRTGEDGGHDWIHLLSTLGLLERSQGIGWFLHKLGAIVVLLALAWAAWLLWQQRSRLGETLNESNEEP